MVIATGIDPVFGVIIASGISALGAYLLAAKKMSGAIRTSDADQLWAESRSIREWSAERISQLTVTISELQARVDAVEDRNLKLAGENVKLINEIRFLNDTIARLRKELVSGQETIEKLTTDLFVAQGRVEVLEEQLAKDDGVVKAAELIVDPEEKEGV